MSTSRGLSWFFLNTAFAKSLTFITQLVLGWILMPGDFGVYAIAISIGVFINMLGNGGIERVLIQRGSEFLELIPTATIYSLFFNLIAMIMFLFISPVVAEFYDDERLYYMLIIMSFILPIGTPAALYRAKLSISRRYKELAIMRTSAASARQVMIVVLAINGFGVYSFVLPMLIEVLVESLVGKYYTQWVPRVNGFSFVIAKDLFNSCKWLMLASVMLGLATTGDFFLLGLFLTKEQLGIYFFGLQLVVSIAAIFSTAIQGVMLPALMPVVSDSSKFRNLFSEALSKIFFISMPVAVLLAVSVGPIIHLVWDGKWDESIQVAQVMFLGMPFWLMVFLGRSGLEALGLWRKRLVYLGIYGATSMLVAVSFAQTKDILYIAIGVALIRSVVGVFQSLSIFHIIKEKYRAVVTQLLLTTVIVSTCASFALAINWLTGFEENNLFSLIVLIAVFVVMYFILVKLFQPQHLLSFYKLLKIKAAL